MASTNLTTGHIPWWKGDWKYWFYFIAHSAGGAGLTLLLLTMCLPLRRVRRNPILISMCLSWWIGSFPNTTLLFFTNNVLGSPPSQATCLASAALVMAQTPLNAMCAVTLVYNVWSVLYFNSARSTPSAARTFILVILPYVVFLICAGSVLTVGFLHPHLVSRATFYCVVKSNVLMVFLGIFGGACCVVAIILEAWIAILLRKNRNSNSPSSKSSGTSGMDVQLAVRVILFGFFIFAGLALSIISVFNWTSVVPDLCFAVFSIAVFAIFGSQKDILRVWKKIFCCCLIKSEQESRRSLSHVRAGSVDPNGKFPLQGQNGHNPYWYRKGDAKESKPEGIMGDLATLRTRNTQADTLGRSPYNSHTDFQFQFESDVGLGLVGNAQGGVTSTTTSDGHKAGKKSKDAWWGHGKGNKNGRPGTGGSSKRPGTAGSNFGEISMSWYPDLGYDFVPEGTSHTMDSELERDVASGTNLSPPKESLSSSSARGGKGHANPHTRHSSATVPSEYIGSPNTPEFVYYQQQGGIQSLPQLASPTTATSPTPLLSNETFSKQEQSRKPVAPIRTDLPHAPTVNSRLHIEHRPSMSTDSSIGMGRPIDSPAPARLSAPPVGGHRESTDGVPEYYLRQHSHTYMHSTDYRSSLDSSIGGGARAAIRGGDPRAGVTTLYDSDYPYDYGYMHSNVSTHQVYAPPPKSAFDRDNSGFQFVSGRKCTGQSSVDSFQTNPSLYGGRTGH